MFDDPINVFFAEFSVEAKITSTKGNFRCRLIYDAHVETFKLGNSEFDSADKVITVKNSDGLKIERDTLIEIPPCHDYPQGVMLKAMRPGRPDGSGTCKIPVTEKTFEDQENDEPTPQEFHDTYEGLRDDG